MRVARILFFLSVIAFSVTVSAQSTVAWDSSGNSTLSGTFNFRQVAFFPSDAFGNLSEAVTLYGNITFNGARDANGDGHYTLTASDFDSSVGVIQQFSTSGTYRISAGGLGFLTNPIFSSGGAVWGMVSSGLFVGSSTEDGINDMFVAAKQPASAFNTASFNGSYAVAEMNFPTVNGIAFRDALFQINPDGTGALGTVNVNGYIGNAATVDTAVTQTISGARYSFNAAGLGTLNYGGTLSNTNGGIVAGSRLFYMSPDKRFIFGGSIAGFDLFVGVVPSANPPPPNILSGLYYQAGLDDAFADDGSGNASWDSYYGTFQVTGGTIWGHQRLLSGFDPRFQYTAFDYTYSDTLTVNTDGTMDDFFGQHHVIGAGGDIRVGFGHGPNLGINVALRAPTFSGGGVFLNPTGLTNFFSQAPFSVGVSPGAFLTLTGTGLASADMTDPTMPFMLGNVQVTVDDRAAPIYHVGPTSIVIVVPYVTTEGYAAIKVLNNGVGSDTRTVFATTTTPGVLADQQGAGHVIAQHLNYSLVTTSNPAMPGEIILFYVEGLGNVSPAVADGVPAPLSPLSPAVANLAARIGGEVTPIIFAGLTPTLIADYAFITTIPADAVPGDRFVDVSGPDSITSIATIPVGGTTTSDLSPVTTIRTRARPPSTTDPGDPVAVPSVATPWGGAVPVRRVDNDSSTSR